VNHKDVNNNNKESVFALACFALSHFDEVKTKNGTLVNMGDNRLCHLVKSATKNLTCMTKHICEEDGLFS